MSQSRCMFIFSRYCQIVFQVLEPVCFCNQQHVRVRVASYSCQHLLFPIFLILTILAGLEQYRAVGHFNSLYPVHFHVYWLFVYHLL